MTSSGWHRKREGTPEERARSRKYGAKPHRDARRYYRAEIAAGRGYCWRCGLPIPSGTPSRAWHVGHDDVEVERIRGAEHRACNLEAAARAGARKRNRTASLARRGTNPDASRLPKPRASRLTF